MARPVLYGWTMGAFMYIGLLATTVLFVGAPLVLFQLMLETVRERACAGVESFEDAPATVRSVRHSLVPSSSSVISL